MMACDLASLHPSTPPQELTRCTASLPPRQLTGLEVRLLEIVTATPAVSYRRLGELLGFGHLDHREAVAQYVVGSLLRAGRLTYVRGTGGKPNTYTVGTADPAQQPTAPAAPRPATSLTPYEVAQLVADIVAELVVPELDALRTEVEQLRALVPGREPAPVRHLRSVPRPADGFPTAADGGPNA